MKSVTAFTILFILQFLVGCTTDSNETNNKVDLVIENGFYKLTSDTIGAKTYTIRFDYFVTGTVRYIEGLNIKLNDTVTIGEYWDEWRELVPGQKYNHTEIMRFTYYITVNPIVTLQGYTEGKSYADPRLKEEFMLKRE